MVYFGNFADLAVRPGGDRSRAAARRLRGLSAGFLAAEGCNIAAFAGPCDSGKPPPARLCFGHLSLERARNLFNLCRMEPRASSSGRGGRVGGTAAAGDIGSFGDVKGQQPPDAPNAETEVRETRSNVSVGSREARVGGLGASLGRHIRPCGCVPPPKESSRCRTFGRGRSLVAWRCTEAMQM